MILMAKKANSLSHTKWMCKYHIVFTPKYRRKIIYNQYKASIRDIIKQLCAYKGVEILEGHLMPDHVHMLVSIPPKISVSSFIGYSDAIVHHFRKFRAPQYVRTYICFGCVKYIWKSNFCKGCYRTAKWLCP